jgi:hypothetical protein
VTESFIDSQIDRLEDFWRRRESATTAELSFSAYGYPVHFATNDPILLEVARISSGRYSRCAPIPDANPIRLHFILDRQMPVEPVPKEWPSRLRYIGKDDWLAVNAEPWVNAFADLRQWTGVAIVSDSLARRPNMVSRFIGDCFVTNMLLRTGWGQLHASCMVRDRRAVLLVAPNNTGKSTTAFRLVMNGYRLLTDGMTYVRTSEQGIELLGYPVGEVKLRLDMLEEFPEVQARGEAALVREDTKMVLNLRQEMPDRTIEDSIWPDQIVLCLLERTGDAETTAEPIDRHAALVGLLPDAAHLDDMQVLLNNLASIQALLVKARCYRLKLGSDVKGILKAVESL